jgi:hypothetical protein
MATPLFTLRGRIAFRDGTSAAGVRVAVVDEDPDLDDLLGVGTTAADGTFRLSFTTDAFNQEKGEKEDRPDIYLVISLMQQDAFKQHETLVTVLRRDFGKLAFANAAMEEDLGTTTLPLDQGENPVALASRVAPGRAKIVKRTRLDDTIVQAAAREVAPLVERLTGWSGLLDGLRIDIVDDPARDLRAQLAQFSGRSDLDERELAIFALATLGCSSTIATWDTAANVMRLYRPALETQNLDYLKVAIGHELVHVGQTRHHPELDALKARHARAVAEALLACRLTPIETAREVHALMANIEGYAAYIERRYLRVAYTHSEEIPRIVDEADEHFRALTLARTLTRLRVPPMQSPPEAERAERDAYSKASQYDSGMAAYVARTDGEHPVPFDPELRPELVQDWSEAIAMIQSLLERVRG